MSELHNFASSYKAMFWDIPEKNIDTLTDTTILERVFCYGDWEQYKHAEKIISRERARDIFTARAYMPRTNLREETIHLFTHYFHVTAPQDRPLSRAI